MGTKIKLFDDSGHRLSKIFRIYIILYFGLNIIYFLQLLVIIPDPTMTQFYMPSCKLIPLQCSVRVNDVCRKVVLENQADVLVVKLLQHHASQEKVWFKIQLTWSLKLTLTKQIINIENSCIHVNSSTEIHEQKRIGYEFTLSCEETQRKWEFCDLTQSGFAQSINFLSCKINRTDFKNQFKILKKLKSCANGTIYEAQNKKTHSKFLVAAYSKQELITAGLSDRFIDSMVESRKSHGAFTVFKRQIFETTLAYYFIIDRLKIVDLNFAKDDFKLVDSLKIFKLYNQQNPQASIHLNDKKEGKNKQTKSKFRPSKELALSTTQEKL